MDRPTKVCNLEFSPKAQQKVLGFNISVNHFLFMTVLKSICKFLHVLQITTTILLSQHFALTQKTTDQCHNHSQWLCVGHRTVHNAWAPYTSLHAAHTPKSKTPERHLGNSYRNSECSDACLHTHRFVKSVSVAWGHNDKPGVKMYTYLRRVWISISLLSWCSTPSFSIWVLKRTFRATITFSFRSRAK